MRLGVSLVGSNDTSNPFEVLVSLWGCNAQQKINGWAQQQSSNKSEIVYLTRILCHIELQPQLNVNVFPLSRPGHKKDTNSLKLLSH